MRRSKRVFSWVRMTLLTPWVLCCSWNLLCLTFSSWSSFKRRFLSLTCYYSINLFWLRAILSSSSFWCLSLAFSSFSAFSFAMSVNFLALCSSNTSLLILFSSIVAFYKLSFCTYLASSISRPSLIALRPPPSAGCTTDMDREVPPNAPGAFRLDIF